MNALAPFNPKHATRPELGIIPPYLKRPKDKIVEAELRAIQERLRAPDPTDHNARTPGDS